MEEWITKIMFLNSVKKSLAKFNEVQPEQVEAGRQRTILIPYHTVPAQILPILPKSLVRVIPTA